MNTKQGAVYSSIYRADLFDGQSIVVTGGGSGIGRCTAHELSSLGAKIALIGRTASKLSTVAGEIEDAGGFATVHPCDIRLEDQVGVAVKHILSAHGAIHGLVNNAGGQFPARIEEISAKGWEAVVNTNLTGGFLMSRECYLQSMNVNGGNIVNIVADMWGSWPMNSHSGAARAGMVSFTETAALEWAHSGVRVNAVAPGWVASAGLDKYPPERQEYIRNLHKAVPLGRIASEAEISASIVFLLSEAASFITGTVLRVDGGRPQGRIGFPMPAQGRTKVFEGFHLAKEPTSLHD